MHTPAPLRQTQRQASSRKGNLLRAGLDSPPGGLSDELSRQGVAHPIARWAHVNGIASRLRPWSEHAAVPVSPVFLPPKHADSSKAHAGRSTGPAHSRTESAALLWLIAKSATAACICLCTSRRHMHPLRHPIYHPSRQTVFTTTVSSPQRRNPLLAPWLFKAETAAPVNPLPWCDWQHAVTSGLSPFSLRRNTYCLRPCVVGITGSQGTPAAALSPCLKLRGLVRPRDQQTPPGTLGALMSALPTRRKQHPWRLC